MTNDALAPSVPAAPKISAVAGLLPRLRLLLSERDIRRVQVCRYAGLHDNTLQRLDDPNWHPRLDTLESIESFLFSFEPRPCRRLAGPGWALSYNNGAERWWIERHGAVSLGPFVDPDAAIDAIEAIIDDEATT